MGFPSRCGAAMSMASLVIYLPNAFAYVIYGNFLDRYPGMTGFRIVFGIMIGWAVIGLGMLTIPNLIAIVILCPQVKKATKEYFAREHISLK